MANHHDQINHPKQRAKSIPKKQPLNHQVLPDQSQSTYLSKLPQALQNPEFASPETILQMNRIAGNRAAGQVISTMNQQTLQTLPAQTNLTVQRKLSDEDADTLFASLENISVRLANLIVNAMIASDQDYTLETGKHRANTLIQQISTQIREQVKSKGANDDFAQTLVDVFIKADPSTLYDFMVRSKLKNPEDFTPPQEEKGKEYFTWNKGGAISAKTRIYLNTTTEGIKKVAEVIKEPLNNLEGVDYKWSIDEESWRRETIVIYLADEQNKEPVLNILRGLQEDYGQYFVNEIQTMTEPVEGLPGVSVAPALTGQQIAHYQNSSLLHAKATVIQEAIDKADEQMIDETALERTGKIFAKALENAFYTHGISWTEPWKLWDPGVNPSFK